MDDHRENIRRLEAGELTADQFRPLRLINGVYLQLAHVKHMLRIKIPAGVSNTRQLEGVAAVTEKWGKGLTHVTTRQDFQIHHLDVPETADAIAMLDQYDVTTRGACSDTVRNVTACPLAGVGPGEKFDVTPYALAVSDHFLFHPMNGKLPRKFKIAVSGCDEDCAQTPINDVGLTAVVRDGRHGFRLVAGGGLGPTPEIAHPVRDFLPAEDLLVVCEAILQMYYRDGERKNRKRNRMKFLVRKTGPDEFRRRIEEQVDAVARTQGDDLRHALAARLASFSDGPSREARPGLPSLSPRQARFVATNTLAQQQTGYRAITVKLALGDITSEQLRGVARIAESLGDGQVRTTNQQNLVLRWVPEADVAQVHEALDALGLGEPDARHITDVVACPGTDYCSLAVTRSMRVGAGIREHLGATAEVADATIADIGRFEIKISGCPNSCGQHHVGDVGLTGIVHKEPDGTQSEYYSIRLGGATGPDTGIGLRLQKRYPEAETPKVIAALAEHYRRERRPGETFRQFVLRVGEPELGRVAAGASARGI